MLVPQSTSGSQEGVSYSWLQYMCLTAQVFCFSHLQGVEHLLLQAIRWVGLRVGSAPSPVSNQLFLEGRADGVAVCG